MKKLHLDIETYSSENILNTGHYRYCESLDFEILMLAYAFDDEPVKVVDLASGEPIPDEFVKAMYDPLYEKWAHNASFERKAFEALGIKIPLGQWRCSAIKAAYCGLPLQLGKISEILDLGEKGKLDSGKSLIKYFSCPVKPTKVNGKRERNFHYHDPEKWAAFKKYCANDVEAEREICKRLSAYEVPAKEWGLYALDQRINDRGVKLDLPMIQNLVDLDNQHSSNLLGRMKDLTGLQNPNSGKQLKEWLGAKFGQEIPSLTKDTIPVYLEASQDDEVKEVLELKLKTSKTSIKKYQAMLNCVCSDGKAHGVFQFYGAFRTGRWAGRLIQLQNLARNYLADLADTRKAFASWTYGETTAFYDNLPSIMSQLVRTALVAPENSTFAVADFSAIEARVIAWLADETWRLDVFKSHGKIYEASAALMFQISIDEVNSSLRQKGKVAELALGYQGAVGALKQMGGESMGLHESEMKDIVARWRDNNPSIVALWRVLEKAATHVLTTGKPVRLNRYKGLIFRYDGNLLTIELPSGRHLSYQTPRLAENKYGRQAVQYKGVHSKTHKWTWLDTYGGKLAENIVQAIARDCLAESMLKLDSVGYPINMHVHDEVVIPVEANPEIAQRKFDDICEIMSKPVPWAPELPLSAAGYITPFYKKDD